MSNSVVGVRFQKLGKLYHFRLPDDKESIDPGDHVIVETKRGRQLGQVIALIEPDKVDRRRGIKAIERKATPRDLVMKQIWEQKELDALITCREQAADLGMADVKFIKAEYSYDGSRLTFMYATENKKLDVRPLGKNLRRVYRARVEMLMIGPRDVAKILGGHGACGHPRCCSQISIAVWPLNG